MIGTTIGGYRIEAEAGAGGMGVVYRAVDTTLRRPVAIKLLNAAAAADPERKRRFVQEAQAASALNHPDIVTVYQIGSEGAIDYIAMEFVAGRSLDHVIGSRPLPLKDVLRIARRVAGALAAAHKAGIVHRDLKPANVMVTDSGGVKLLDFGVAKLTEPAVAHASTTTIAAATATGLIVGTPAYMSPEQRQGQAVDARSDIYAFGLLLFEMLTGRRLPGEFDPASLAATPRDVRTVAARCLRENPAERFQVMDDVSHALEDVDVSPAAVTPASHPSRWPAALGLVAVVSLFAAALLLWRTRTPPERPPLVLTRATSDSGLTTDPALSADGRLLAFASDRAGNGSLDIWVRQVAGGMPVRLTEDAADDREPSFSPDGTQIAFESDRDGGGIYVMPALGGEARRVADGCHRPRWSPSSKQIVCWAGVNTGYLLSRADAPRIFLVAASGEEPRRLFPEFAVAWAPVWSADGARILFAGKRGETDDQEWWIAAADGSSPQSTGIAASLTASHLNPPSAVFVPEVWTTTGYVLFTASLGNPNVWTIINDSVNLWRIAVDADGRTRSRPERIMTGATLDSHPSVSADGVIAFAALRQHVDLWSVPIDASAGKPTGPAEPVTDDPAFDGYPTLPPDDSRLLFLSNRSGAFELWMKERERLSVLASGVAYPSMPILSRDGSLAIYASGAPYRYYMVATKPGTHAATPRVVCQDCDVIWDLTADNRAIVYTREADSSVRVRDVATGQDAVVTAAPGDIIGRLRLSPDDRWAVFNHRSGGTIRLTVVPFTPGAPVSRGQWIAVTPENTVVNAGLWSPDGHLLYFLSDLDGHMCVWAEPIDHETGKVAGDPFPVWHFHEARRSMAPLPLPSRGIGLSRNRLVVSVVESAGNVWLAK